MRVVAGRLKGRPLATPKGTATRPTTDRMRESLFNILLHGMGEPLEGANVIDLFAGSGALGIEALSRGAGFCLFLDEDAAARAAIRSNCQALGLNGITKIFRRDATSLGPLERFRPFTLAFLDPPYRRGLGERALASLAEGGWLAPGALCIWEESREAQLDVPAGYVVEDRRLQGSAVVTFLRRAG